MLNLNFHISQMMSILWKTALISAPLVLVYELCIQKCIDCNKIRIDELDIQIKVNEKADLADSSQIGAPLQGMISKIFVKKSDQIEKNTPLFVIEAMKMETTVSSTYSGTISAIKIEAGTMVKQDDLIMLLEEK